MLINNYMDQLNFFDGSSLKKMKKDQSLALNKFNKCLISIYDKLSKSYEKNNCLFSEKEQEKLNDLVYLYMDIFNSIDPTIVIHEDKENTQKLFFQLCKTLRLLGLFFLNFKDENPEQLPKRFWLLCYHLWITAEKFGVMNRPIKTNSEFKINVKAVSFALLFKQLLIYQQLDSQHLSHKDRIKLFNALIKVSDYVNIKHSLNVEQKKIVTKFCLEKDAPPSRLEYKITPPLKTLRYLDLDDVIKVVDFLLYEAQAEMELNSKSNLPPSLYIYLLKTLEQQKTKRRYTRIKSKHSCQAIFGIHNVINFLLEKEGKTANQYQHTYPLDTSNNDNTSDTNNNASSTIILDRPEKEILLINDLTIVDNSINGYSVFWQNELTNHLQVGNIIGILPQKNSASYNLEIGLIRRINHTHDGVVLGVELIAFHSTLVFIERENRPQYGEWVLFLFGSHHYAINILGHHSRHYKIGENISIQVAKDKKIPCRLGEVLNANEFITQIVLRY